MIGKFFHIPKPKPFNITTRYYDPELEVLNERVKKVKEEMGIVEEKVEDGKPYRPDIRGKFRSTMDQKSKTIAQARNKSNTRLIILILILVLIAYLIFYR
jgi:t-SNARE complex subunit (syntaxin)